MPLKQIDCPSLGRTLSNLMAAPSSADANTHQSGLEAYHRLGGNCLHLHGEGGETHSRRLAGEWLQEHRLRPEFFLCTQVCHDEWDADTEQAISRFTPEGIQEDIAINLELLGTDRLDLVYLDDHPTMPFEPVIAALGREIAQGRVQSWGVRNWTAPRIKAAQIFAAKRGMPGIGALITTELSYLKTTQPLWPGYIAFDTALKRLARQWELTVFAHADDLNLGQCLLGDADPASQLRPEWIERWNHPENIERVQIIQTLAAKQTLTDREMNLAWLLNQSFPTIGIVGLPSLLTDHAAEYERTSGFIFDETLWPPPSHQSM